MFSNMAPIWAKKIPFLDTLDIPLDGGKTFRGHPIFGRNKTYRGIVAGLIFAVSIALVQYGLSEQFDVLNRLEFFDMGVSEYVELALLIGLGALVGDAFESFLKRQINIKPGEAWVPFDQIDYVIGALIFSIPVGALSISQYAAAALVGISLHPIATVIGWKLGLKDKPI